ncbi:MAG: hypothetical protein Q9160_004391 [Pyrenula sp. 1 TL-2023]
MSAPATKASRPKARQSISHLPASDTQMSDKENMTVDTSTIQDRKVSLSRNKQKKSRSKSFGPGGLEALKEGSGNSAKPFTSGPIKSILKPTVPLTPPQAIPTFEASRKQSTGRGNNKSPRKNADEDLLIDFSTPGPSTKGPMVSSSENLSNPFSPLPTKLIPNKVDSGLNEGDEGTKTEELDEEARRRSEKQAILDQRAARRKSMANRRVSFAPEATLHTWNVVELAEDSTTSSASNSTRRQSSMTASQSPLIDVHSPAPEPDPSDPPSTPPEQVEEPLVKASPAHQRDLHQKKHRRRSSGVPPMNFNNPDDEAGLSSSSPFSGSSTGDVESSPGVVEESINSDDSDEEGDTAMSIEEVAGQTEASVESGSSTRSSLDERLRQAAHEAGTPGIEHDENFDDVSMEMATESVTHAFQPFAKKAANGNLQDLTSMQDQENVNPFSPAFRKGTHQSEPQRVSTQDETEDVSMDMTTAMGMIVPQGGKKASPGKSRRKSVGPSRRRSSVARRRSSGANAVAEDETMEFTTAAGGILSQQALTDAADEDIDIDEDEEMTMELTTAVGGLINQGQASRIGPTNIFNNEDRRTSQDSSVMEDETMEMTAAIGGILPPIEERTEPNTDAEDTQPMEITKAIGELLPTELKTDIKSKAKQLMEAETDVGQLKSSPLQDRMASPSPNKRRSMVSDHVNTTIASELGSPSMALKPRLSGRKSLGGRQSMTPSRTGSKQSTPVKQISRQSTPVKPSALNVATPTKQLTPQPDRPDKPERTPIINSNVAFRSASPKKLFKAEIKAKSSPASAKKSPRKSGLFSQDSETGQQTPNVVLAPKPHQHLRRRSSGVGVDKEGLGSPRVSKLLDRRGSIGESVPAFVPNPKQLGGVKFADPKQMENEVDAEREEEERRESGRFAMEQEADMPADEDNPTLTLKEMIESMTPKKNKLKGRKSLAVGAAKGVLGKRPVELDLDDENEDPADATPKRLRMAAERSQSPVKKAHLPAPPSKAETTGRMTRAKRKSLEETTGNAQTPTLSIQSPSKSSIGAKSPKPAHGRFKDAPIAPTSSRPTSFEDKLDNVVIGAIDAEVEQILANEEPASTAADEKIHLQDFLNMTGIHFMELNATKRRHTAIAPTPSTGPKLPSQALINDPEAQEQEPSLADTFVAATTTLPLLELYQHATRELKSYISSGRKIIRSIEAETLEEQPPLFREYLDARPDVKVVMDNQFRNGKVNARLRSKEGWYRWRGELVEGLRGGLEAIREDLVADEAALSEREGVLREEVPGLEKRGEELSSEEERLSRRVEELESVDREEVRSARERLGRVEGKLAGKKELLEGLREQMKDKEETMVAVEELKEEFEGQIAEAERVREECRGWDPRNVQSIKERVERIEKQCGWKIVTAEEDEEEEEYAEHGPALTMRYKEELRLFFYPKAFVTPAEQAAGPGRRKSSHSSSSETAAPISLTYVPPPSTIDDVPPTTARDLPTEKRFLLQFLQSHVQALASMPRGTVSAAKLLSAVARGWDLAGSISEEARLLELVGMGEVNILGDEVLGVRSVLVLPGRKGRVDVDFRLAVGVASRDDKAVEVEVGVGVDVNVRAVHGEGVMKALEGRGGEAVREVARRGFKGSSASSSSSSSSLKMGGGLMANAVREVLAMVGQGRSEVVVEKQEKEKETKTRERTPKAKTPKRR